jgi:hypothetical protein
VVYLDDLVVIGNTFQQHVDNLEAVFERLKMANLKLKPEKCQLFRQEILFFGHKVSTNGILPDPGKIKAVAEWPPALVALQDEAEADVYEALCGKQSRRFT